MARAISKKKPPQRKPKKVVAPVSPTTSQRNVRFFDSRKKDVVLHVYLRAQGILDRLEELGLLTNIREDYSPTYKDFYQVLSAEGFSLLAEYLFEKAMLDKEDSAVPPSYETVCDDEPDHAAPDCEYSESLYSKLTEMLKKPLAPGEIKLYPIYGRHGSMILRQAGKDGKPDTFVHVDNSTGYGGVYEPAEGFYIAIKDACKASGRPYEILKTAAGFQRTTPGCHIHALRQFHELVRAINNGLTKNENEEQDLKCFFESCTPVYTDEHCEVEGDSEISKAKRRKTAEDTKKIIDDHGVITTGDPAPVAVSAQDRAVIAPKIERANKKQKRKGLASSVHSMLTREKRKQRVNLASASFFNRARKKAKKGKPQETYLDKLQRNSETITMKNSAGKEFSVWKNQRVLTDFNKFIFALHRLSQTTQEERTKAFWKTFIKETDSERREVYRATPDSEVHQSLLYQATP